MSSKSPRRKFQSATVQHLYDRYIGDDPKRIESFEGELLNAEIARKIYDLRTKRIAEALCKRVEIRFLPAKKLDVA